MDNCLEPNNKTLREPCNVRITIVEDNEDLANAIGYRLRATGHSTDLLSNGLEAERFLRREGSDLVIVDGNLPGKDGFDLIQSLRENGFNAPIILVTARTGVHERVNGLNSGADDYLMKPFEMEELEARIRALSRRQAQQYVTLERFGPLEYDRTHATLSADGDLLFLPRREMSVLACLMANQGRITSKSSLVDQVYGIGADVDESAVESHISRLRQRLKSYGITIKVARGLGYMIEELPL